MKDVLEGVDEAQVRGGSHIVVPVVTTLIIL